MIRHTHGEPTLHRLSPTENAELITKRAVRHLVHYSSSSALLITTMRRPTRIAHPFPCQDTYAELAAHGGCAMRVVVERVGEGYDHHLFLVREYNLSDDDVMDCRPPVEGQADD
jgi:hypothetical protein